MANEPETEQDPAGAELETEAFKQLYPQQFFERFFAEGLRPDGRTLGRARPLSLGLGAISTAAGSCLTKLGSTTVLAGVRATVGEQAEQLDVQQLPEAAGAATQGAGTNNKPPPMGVLKVNVELAPFAMQDTRNALAHEALARLTQRLEAALQPLQLPQQLAIPAAPAANDGGGTAASRPAAYHVHLDAYVLDADGSVFDALLLAVLGALGSTRLPPIAAASTSASTGAKATRTKASKQQRSAEEEGAGAADEGGRRLQLPHVPLSVSCALAGQHLLVDPTREEEGVAGALVCVVLDAQGALHGLYKTGGVVAATPMTLVRCIEAAKLRYKEVAEQLEAALAAHWAQSQEQPQQQQ